MAYASPQQDKPGAMSASNTCPLAAAKSRKESAVSATTPLMSTLTKCRGGFSSSSRARVTMSFTNCAMCSVCARALSIHFCRPTSISSTFRLVAMTVNGVFSSWLASVMNRFCFSALFTTGSMAFLENSQIRI